MKGLIIKPYWADLILNGQKTIEVRGSNTKIRGTIGIIKSKSKKIYGTVELFHCVELTKELFENIWKDRHCIDMSWEQLIQIYPKPYAWCLKDVNIFKEPISYEHKKGCVIWVNLEDDLIEVENNENIQSL